MYRDILNTYIPSGIFSKDWKIARVAPIYRSGCKSEIGNYRPISVLPTQARIFERLVYTQLTDYLERSKYLTKQRSAMSKKNSDDWLLNIEKWWLNGVISFDLKKAFNTIDYVILFVKLSWYGVLENGLKWFTSYLTGGGGSSYFMSTGYFHNLNVQTVEFHKDHVWDLFCS